MIGKTLAHYEIMALLGKGGMGEVYRARDTRLDRDVALKILPTEMAGNPERLDRFHREAKTLAGLNHPHIVHMYSVEEQDGVRFLTMELVEGEGLEAVVSPDGLPLAEVLEIGIAIAAAFTAAHEKGVVHRDLKPANVMITKDGHVKVLDFGLAKLTAVADTSPDSATMVSPATMDGAVLGTVPYMSPEQLRGQNVDHRSDIFSFGILLYELASGRRPFVGASNADLISSILKETPPPVTQLKPELPPSLGHIIRRCLEKDPNDRYDFCGDIRDELRKLRKDLESSPSGTEAAVSGPAEPQPSRARGKRLAVALATITLAIIAVVMIQQRGRDSPLRETTTDHTPVTASTTGSSFNINSVAVMAFADMSPHQDQAYFSDGIAEELLNLLARIPELKVTSRTSAFSYKGKNIALSQIAQDLGVAHILEGSVRKAGDRVRITVNLGEARTDTQLWSKTYERTLEDVFAIQDEIAADVVSHLRVRLLGDTPKAARAHPDAYDLYLKAGPLVEWGLGPNPDDLGEGIDLLERAVAIDSSFAAGFARLSRARSALHLVHPIDPGAIELAKLDADRAIRLHPQSGGARLAKALFYYRMHRDLDAALVELEEGRRLAPKNAEILSWIGTMKKRRGKYGEAKEFLDQAVELDPRNPTVLGELAIVQQCLGNYVASVDYADRSIAATRRFSSEVYRAGIFRTWTADLTPMRELLERYPDSPETRASRVQLLIDEDRFGDALAMLDVLAREEAVPIRRAVYQLKQARLRWVMGESDEAKKLASTALPVLSKSGHPFDQWLSIALAILGKQEETAAEVSAALARLEASSNVLAASHRLGTVAEAMTINGDYASAVSTLKRQLQSNGTHTVAGMMFNPVFDRLHDRDDFKALVLEHGP